MEQLLAYLRNGLSPKPSVSPPGFRILRINAVRPMRVELTETRYLDLPKDQVKCYIIENNDLLFTRYNGSVDLLGVAGMVRSSPANTLHPDKLIRVKAALGQPLLAYLEIACNVGLPREHMKRRARTTAGQTGISGPDIREMPIPLPPLGEQSRIVAEVDRRLSVLDELEGTVAADLKRIDRFRQSILKRAFEGKLVSRV
jgi:type I restriction enzyme S subunit